MRQLGQCATARENLVAELERALRGERDAGTVSKAQNDVALGLCHRVHRRKLHSNGSLGIRGDEMQRILIDGDGRFTEIHAADPRGDNKLLTGRPIDHARTSSKIARTTSSVHDRSAKTAAGSCDARSSTE